MDKYLVSLISIVLVFLSITAHSNPDSAKQAEQAGQNIERPPTGPSVAEMNYSRSIQRKILKNWTVPEDLTVNEGDYLMVRFKISQGGKIVSKEIERSSGNAALNRHALEILNKSTTFPPFPEEMSQYKFLEFGIRLKPPKN